MSLQPLHRALGELCQLDILSRQLKVFHSRAGGKIESALWQELEEKAFKMLSLVPENTRDAAGQRKGAEAFLEELLALRMLLQPDKDLAAKGAVGVVTAKQYLQEYFLEKPEAEKLFLLTLYIRGLVESASEKRHLDGRTMFAAWMLDEILADILRSWDFSESGGKPALSMIRIACGLKEMVHSFSSVQVHAGEGVAAATGRLIKTMITDEDVQALLQMHRFQEDLFFNREAFEKFCAWLTILIMWELNRAGKKARAIGNQSAGDVLNVMNFLPVLAAKAEYKLEAFLKNLAQLAAE